MKATSTFTSRMGPHIECYLALKQALGREYDGVRRVLVHLDALLRWYRSGADVQAKLPLLAIYMGHVSIASTEYYLKFVEPLRVSASERFARHCGGVVVMPANTGGVR